MAFALQMTLDEQGLNHRSQRFVRHSPLLLVC
jgi:hypothetical protein